MSYRNYPYAGWSATSPYKSTTSNWASLSRNHSFPNTSVFSCSLTPSGDGNTSHASYWDGFDKLLRAGHLLNNMDFSDTASVMSSPGRGSGAAPDTGDLASAIALELSSCPQTASSSSSLSTKKRKKINWSKGPHSITMKRAVAKVISGNHNNKNVCAEFSIPARTLRRYVAAERRAREQSSPVKKKDMASYAQGATIEPKRKKRKKKVYGPAAMPKTRAQKQAICEAGSTDNSKMRKILNQEGYIKIVPPGLNGLIDEELLVSEAKGGRENPIFGGGGRTQIEIDRSSQLNLDIVASRVEQFLHKHFRNLTKTTWVALKSPPGGTNQPHHSDYRPSLLEGVPQDQIPLVVIVPIMDNTKITAWPKAMASKLGEIKGQILPKTLFLNKGEILIFRGDLIHAGAAYSEENVRLHCYVDTQVVLHDQGLTWQYEAHAPKDLRDRLVPMPRTALSHHCFLSPVLQGS